MILVVGVTIHNSNAIMILSFLIRLVDVLKSYFKALEEESIRDNFVTTYELLDEMMDAGYPQITGNETSNDVDYFLQKEKYFANI